MGKSEVTSHRLMQDNKKELFFNCIKHEREAVKSCPWCRRPLECERVLLLMWIVKIRYNPKESVGWEMNGPEPPPCAFIPPSPGKNGSWEEGDCAIRAWNGAANFVVVVLTVAAHKKAHFPGRGVRRISTSARGDEKSTQRYFSQMGLPTRYRYTTAVSTPRFTVYYSAKCTT